MFKDHSSKRLSVTDTLIGQGTVAEGKISCEAGLRVEGEYRGDITCKGDVIIGECGVARSNIEARDVTIAGKVYGDIQTTGRLTITSSGQLHGNVAAKALIILDGAVLNGSCRMNDKQSEGAKTGSQPHAVQDRDNSQQSAKEQREGAKARQAG
ncbi:bactofilin family protein [Paenibacillus tarimensis]|uniref:bactofilin family protein n=1 Tax=Paenibacillus tarimensis TaxID=416012 RepID=UPI001F32020A|nr:polymer-forming cytoskeletal protein [Paenibacillus tarimensis]MCF2945989.1 polymer-forming cytoskeletal protein [Paenibacillus tarimensis]